MLLREFWADFNAKIAEMGALGTREAIDALDENLSSTLYPPNPDGSDPRVCPRCGSGRLNLKPSRTGAFGVSQYFPSHEPWIVEEPMTLEPAETVSRNDSVALSVAPDQYAVMPSALVTMGRHGASTSGSSCAANAAVSLAAPTSPSSRRAEVRTMAALDSTERDPSRIGPGT